jgi:exodeoxyribonuclease VII small subunit
MTRESAAFPAPPCAESASGIKYLLMKSKMKFEDALAELKEIIKKLESGNLPLEDSIKLFQEGTDLISFSHKKLNEIRKKVEILVEKNGETAFEDFEPES